MGRVGGWVGGVGGWRDLSTLFFLLVFGLGLVLLLLLLLQLLLVVLVRVVADQAQHCVV